MIYGLMKATFSLIFHLGGRLHRFSNSQLNPTHCIYHILSAYDMVSVKHAPGLVAARFAWLTISQLMSTHTFQFVM